MLEDLVPGSRRAAGAREPVSGTRVLVVAEAASTHRFVRSTLETCDRYAVVGEAADGRTAVTLARELQPDVVLVAVSAPSTSASSTLRAVRHVAPLARAFVLSRMEPEAVDTLLADGAEAVVPIGPAPGELLEQLASLLGPVPRRWA